ncbi:MAG: hypothetical protein KDK70_03785 [Myxococcales bacterium]|nr:hypothetical protein [Myxococcales bacterium]
MALGLLPGLAHAHSPAHREPLPTIEVVQSPKRVRLIDVRGPVQYGAGWSTLYDAPVHALSFEVSASFVELGERTWLHLTFGESALVSALRSAGQDEASGMLGADLGVGIAAHARRGPAFVLTASAGPRWDFQGPDRLRPHGFGVGTKAELFPFYVTVPDLVHDERGWFRRFVASGLHVWGQARYDQLLGHRGNAWTAGVGLDVGRSVLLPVLLATMRRTRRR